MKKNWLLALGSLFFTTALYFFWWYSPFLSYLDYKIYDALTYASPSEHTPTSTVVVEIDDKSLKQLGQWPWPRMITAKLIENIAANKPSVIALDMVFSEPDRTSPSTMRSFYNSVLNQNIMISGLPDGLQDNDAILSDVIHRSPVVLPIFSSKDMQSNVCILPNTVTVTSGLQNADLYILNNLVCSLRSFQERSHGVGHIHVEADEDGILRRVPLAVRHQDVWIASLGVAAVASVSPGVHSDTTHPLLGGMRFDIGGHCFFADRYTQALLNFYPHEQYEKISAVDILSGAVKIDRLKGKYVLIGSTALGLDSTYILSDGSVRSGVFVHATLLENILNSDLGVQPSLYKTLNFFVSFTIGLLLLVQMVRRRYLSVVIIYFSVLILAIFATYLAWQYHVYISTGFFAVPLSAYLFVLALLMFFIDYHNKKKFIDELRRSTEQKKQLQSALTQSEAELEYQKAMLYQQSKLAAMGEMIDTIAHQWKQPLNLLGMIIQDAELTFARGGADAAYMRNMRVESMEQILFMSQTITDFRNFLKPDQKNTPFDINQSVKESLHLLKGMFSSNGITVSVEYSDLPLIVAGSSSEFKQVIVNLLQNARDALMEHNRKSPAIKICLLKNETDAVLTVADNGGGIPEDVIGRIFEPHFTTKGEGKGSGVGLYISSAIIQGKMGGKLDVSNIENGAKFTITIPLFAS